MQSVFSSILLAVGVASFQHRIGIDHQALMSQDVASLSKAEVERSASQSSDHFVEDQQTNIAGRPWPLSMKQPESKASAVQAIVDEIMTKVDKNQCWDLFVAKGQPFLSSRGGAVGNPIQFKVMKGKNMYKQLSLWVHPDKVREGVDGVSKELAAHAAEAFVVLKTISACFSQQKVQVIFQEAKIENVCPLCFTQEAAAQRHADNRAEKIAAAEKAEKIAADEEAAELAEKVEQIKNGKVCCCKFGQNKDTCENRRFRGGRFFEKPEPNGSNSGQCCKIRAPKFEKGWKNLSSQFQELGKWNPCFGRTHSKTFVAYGCSAPDRDSDIPAGPAGATGATSAEGSAGYASAAPGID